MNGLIAWLIFAEFTFKQMKWINIMMVSSVLEAVKLTLTYICTITRSFYWFSHRKKNPCKTGTCSIVEHQQHVCSSDNAQYRSVIDCQIHSWTLTTNRPSFVTTIVVRLMEWDCFVFLWSTWTLFCFFEAIDVRNFIPFYLSLQLSHFLCSCRTLFVC